MKLSSFKLDLNAAEDGIVVQMGEGATIRVAKWDNEAHSKFKRELFKKYSAKIQNKTVTDEELERALEEEWQFILRDISGFEDVEAYSPQLVIDLKRNPQYEEFFKFVEKTSKDEKNYRIDTIKSLGEASPDSSNGQ